MQKRHITLITLALLVGVCSGFVLAEVSQPHGNHREVPHQQSQDYASEVFTFTCQNEAIITIQYAESADYARLALNGVSYELKRERAASGARYVGKTDKVSFWEHQGEAMVTLPEMEGAMTCQLQTDQFETDTEMITVTSPKSGAAVGNPMILAGEARGYWFFEASAPVIVVNWDGLIIGEGYVTAQGDWMTEELVPFTGSIEYDLPADSYSTEGTVILKRDNPSGLAEHDAAVEVPVVLSPASIVVGEDPQSESIVCTDEAKAAEMCTMEYAPVCGLVQVQCITAPCDPIPETFSNGCSACSQGNVISYTEGACEV